MKRRSIAIESGHRPRGTHTRWLPLAFQGVHEVLEGEPVDGIAIVNFPSMAAVRAWYASPEKLLQPTALSTPVIRCSTSSLVAAHAGMGS